MSIVVTVSTLAVIWCVINIVVPIRRLGIKSRKSAFLLLMLALPACIGSAVHDQNERSAALAALKISDPKAYLVALRQDQGDEAYLTALKEVDPARWKAEAPSIQAALDKAKHDREMAEKAAEKAKKYADMKANSEVWIARGEEAVAANLKDPSSAQFRNVFFHMAKIDGKDAPISCGEVNSKNSFGGYNGYQRYISAGTPELSYLEEEVADFSRAWKIMCVK
jgi:hypothetical protein